MNRKKNSFVLCILFGSLSAQVAMAGDADLAKISKDVSSRIDFKVERTKSNRAGDSDVFFRGPLTVESAIQTALLNNQSLQAVLESWGIAKADFNRTRLPDKPVFDASYRVPDHDINDNVEFAIEQDFLSLALFPLKSNLAGAELHKAELEITREVLDLIFEVKTAFYEVQGEAAMLAMRKRVLVQAEASEELAKRQFEVGNISELKFANERSVYQDTKLEYLKAEAELVLKTENLNRLMGFGGKSPSWEIRDELGDVQVSDPSYEELLSIGMSKRLDLLIARKNVEALRHALSLSRFGVLGHPEIGASTEKDVEGGRVTGPTFRTEVPIYDLGQTEVSRSGAELRQAELKLKALENDVRSEIKQKRDRLFAARILVEQYTNSVIPIKEKVTGETLKHQNYMLVGNYELIRAKQEEILAKKEYIDVLKDYWIARSDLEKAISSKLPLDKSHAHHQGGSHE